MIKFKTFSFLMFFFIFAFTSCEKEVIVTNTKEQIILQPNASDGTDAIISSINEIQNYGSEPDASIAAVYNSGQLNVTRFAIKFDLSTLPEGAIITKAYLSLYFNNTSGISDNHAGDNYFTIRRITTDWTENTISWQNQPILTNTNQITVPKSTIELQDFTNIDVTSLVKDLVFYTENSYGFFIRLQSETATKIVLLASSDHQNANYHPKLEVNYILKN